MEYVCALCNKALQKETIKEGKCLEGHYFYDNKVYCISCWIKEYPEWNKPLPAQTLA